jgi:hypothetical protein
LLGLKELQLVLLYFNCIVDGGIFSTMLTRRKITVALKTRTAQTFCCLCLLCLTSVSFYRLFNQLGVFSHIIISIQIQVQISKHSVCMRLRNIKVKYQYQREKRNGDNNVIIHNSLCGFYVAESVNEWKRLQGYTAFS